jgi:hypothetical protein
MPLLFLGDVASPTVACSQQFSDSLRRANRVFAKNDIVLNLEGMICAAGLDSKTPVLFNDPSVIPVLKQMNAKAVTLANNHSLDLPMQLDQTKQFLRSASIESCGAGRTLSEAEAPAVFWSEGQQILVFGFCWNILIQHQRTRTGVCCVNPLMPVRALSLVREARRQYPNAVLVAKMHWSFDLETQPFPLYRRLGRCLIDAGANAIIGCHSHCVQGGERYKNGIIVYGLGNFYIPWNTFANGTIHFPEFCRREIGVEYDPVSNSALCHWFMYNNSPGHHSLAYDGEEDFDSGERIKEVSKYRHINDRDYDAWFRVNRRKGFMMPIYRDHRDRLRNFCIDYYLRGRIRFARLLARMRIREWNN